MHTASAYFKVKTELKQTQLVQYMCDSLVPGESSLLLKLGVADRLWKRGVIL